MGEQGERYRKVAAAFTRRVQAVPEDGWDRPAPCEGWVARDVVAHLVEWVPAFFFGTWGIPPLDGPPAATDPVGAWEAFDAAMQAAFDDPVIAESERDTHMGRATFEATVGQICTTDVLIHTWDLARATGQDEELDPDEVHAYVMAMEPLDTILRESGHYGPRVAVPDDADEQTRLLAFLGRQP
jgi:uncharacterized protein (TIGR03086 family)